MLTLVFSSFAQGHSCGSGDVSKFISDLVGARAFLLSTDVNPSALSSTRAQLPCPAADLLRGDLFSCFRGGQLFDVVVFNPPYVPTDDYEFQQSLQVRDISASWAGGRHGREVIDRFLRTVGSYLSDSGVLYLVLIDLNDVQDVLKFARRFGLVGQIVMERLAGIEKLYVIRFVNKVT